MYFVLVFATLFAIDSGTASVQADSQTECAEKCLKCRLTDRAVFISLIGRDNTAAISLLRSRYKRRNAKVVNVGRKFVSGTFLQPS